MGGHGNWAEVGYPTALETVKGTLSVHEKKWDGVVGSAFVTAEVLHAGPDRN
jgi:hypothetical protein